MFRSVIFASASPFPALKSCSIFHRLKSYYTVLGLKPVASLEDVKAAYYKLSKKYHPDTNFGNLDAMEKMMQVNEAFETLGNPTKKLSYDRENFPDQLSTKEIKTPKSRGAYIRDNEPKFYYYQPGGEPLQHKMEFVTPNQVQQLRMMPRKCNVTRYKRKRQHEQCKIAFNMQMSISVGKKMF